MEAAALRRLYRDGFQVNYNSMPIPTPPAALGAFHFAMLDLAILHRYTVVWPSVIENAMKQYTAGISRRPIFPTKGLKDHYAAQEIYCYGLFLRTKEGPFWQPETSRWLTYDLYDILKVLIGVFHPQTGDLMFFGCFELPHPTIVSSVSENFGILDNTDLMCRSMWSIVMFGTH